jgi:hypothetical protein
MNLKPKKKSLNNFKLNLDLCKLKIDISNLGQVDFFF